MKRAAFVLVGFVAFAAPILAQVSRPAQRRPATTAATQKTPPAPVGMSNQDVIKMVAAGLSDGVIINAIHQAAKRSFDLSVDGLIALKQGKVPDVVILAMQAPKADVPAPPEPPKVAATPPREPTPPSPAVGEPASSAPPAAVSSQSPGIYLAGISPSHGLTSLEPVPFHIATGGAAGMAFTFGIKKMTVKAVVDGSRASVRTAQPLPRFLFVFGGSGLWGTSSPKEFILARATVKDGRRELVVAKGSMWGVKSGTQAQDEIPFKFERVTSETYWVTPASELEPGEYVLISGLNQQTSKGVDFGIDR